MNVTQQIEGRRVYLLGNTFPIKDALKNAGAHWDGDRRAWWIGTEKQAAISNILGGAPQAEAKTSGNGGSKGEALKDSDRLLGKAEYKGRTYLLVWEGETKRGRAAKLAFLDGSSTFWASHGEYNVTKYFKVREFRGREEYQTWGRYRSFIEDAAKARKEGVAQCGKCNGFHRDGDNTCYMCGCTKCEGAHGGLCEED